MEVKHHFIRDKITRKEIKTCYVPTETMIADCLTKPFKIKLAPFSHWAFQVGEKKATRHIISIENFYQQPCPVNITL